MANNLESMIQVIVSRVANELATEIANTVRRTIAAEIAGSIGGGHDAIAGRRAPGRPRKNGLGASSSMLHAVDTTTGRPRRGKGSRRTSDQVATDDSKILAHVKAHAGQRALEIGNHTGLDKKSIASGLLRLRAAKKVKTKGQRSATTYSAA